MINNLERNKKKKKKCSCRDICWVSMYDVRRLYVQYVQYACTQMQWMELIYSDSVTEGQIDKKLSPHLSVFQVTSS